MILALRAYFLSRLLREKILLLGFILIGTLWWGSAYFSRSHRFWVEQRRTTIDLKEQQLYLDRRVEIETAAQKAASQLDPRQTLDGIRLASAVSQAAYDAGLRNNYGSNPLPPQTNGVFTIHSIQFQVNNADYVMLEQFYLNLHKRAPYIGIEQFTLRAANPADASKLTLILRVSSVEIPRVEG
jgi:hypothetical protein